MTASILPDNQDDREVFLREHGAAKFIDAVTRARRDKLDTLIFTLGAFSGEPDLLYVAIAYASYSGVDLTVPSRKREPD